MRFVRKLFASAASPIGVDFGSASLKVAQLDGSGEGAELIAFAQREVPAEIAGDAAARLQFFAQEIPALLSRGGFRGRRAVLGLPAANTCLERVRVPLLDAEGFRQAIEYEASQRLPFFGAPALIRHIVAGDVYEGDERRSEVIVMATRRKLIDDLLAIASRAQLEVVGFNAEPIAIARCLAPRGASAPAAASGGKGGGDDGGAVMIVDIGSSGSRIYVVVDGQIHFARAVNIGAVELDRAVAQRLNISSAEARARRMELSATRAAHGYAPAADGAAALNETLVRVEHACFVTFRKLAHEMLLCARYFHVTFPATHVSQVMFLGGAAAHARLCQMVAEEVGLRYRAVGAILARPVDQSQAAKSNAAWAVAVGLSLTSLKKAA
jgi:type IV pilus assembly protein PilM